MKEAKEEDEKKKDEDQKEDEVDPLDAYMMELNKSSKLTDVCLHLLLKTL